MKKMIFTVALCLSSIATFAQIEGKWETIDDGTGKPESIVEIVKKSNGKYYGKIKKLLVKPENPKCIHCKDDRKNQPIEGIEFIRDLKKEGDEFTGGTIMDPKNGKVYKCSIKKDGNKLIVRGYIGISLIGRNQTWTKIK